MNYCSEFALKLSKETNPPLGMIFEVLSEKIVRKCIRPPLSNPVTPLGRREISQPAIGERLKRYDNNELLLCIPACKQ